MKKRNFISTICLAALLFISCAENEFISFSESDTFVAFDQKTFNIDETSVDSLMIPVTLSSISGMAATIEFEIDTASVAVSGENFTIVGGNSLTFTKEAPTQYIVVKAINNDLYTGDLKFILVLKENSSVNLGASSSCTVTVVDDEHPLAAILGTFAASADSYFSSRGHFDWNVTVMKDESDATKVWIGNLDPYFGNYGYTYDNGYNLFYGVVNEEKTVISVPVGQEIGYDGVVLTCFNDPDPDVASEQFIDSGNMEITISEDGNTLTITNAWGMYEDGFWNLFYGGITLKK